MSRAANANVHDRLLHRELFGSSHRYTNIKGLYGDKAWAKDLDIINELDGHSGCVNALSWSKNGRLLASGSDDQHLNIHEYLTDGSANSFKLATTVSTGHRANIFSVKFMPHSNDRTLVTAAGDSEIRIFDIEYTGQSSGSHLSDVRSSARAQGLMHQGVQYLSEGDTNARVYRSHSDRVKRIVTESSPYLFLSCSEDGEVRQWDLRQPSSAYPLPRHSRSWATVTEDDDSGVPPPLISYKRHGLELNTISCSPSQPHYIALGGGHLHAFLHDRRMMGRDKDRERGEKRPMNGSSDHEDNMMREATQCVRRFAPHGQREAPQGSSGHITALKISDANPNEMIASWSGDHIYGFDLVRSPDADQQADHEENNKARRRADGRVKNGKDRKRKRHHEGSLLSQEGAGRQGTRPRRRQPAHELEHDENEEVALRVRYENGQSESIPLRQVHEDQDDLQEAAEANMTEADRKSYRIANTSVKIRKHMFTLGDARESIQDDPTGHGRSFTSALGFCASVLEDVDETIRTWRYPVDPEDVDVVLQTTLRRNRESARRFIQASGTVARLLGGKLRTGGGGQHPMLSQFTQIQPAPNESKILDESEQFRYDFIKAVCLWLDSGPGALAEGFARRGNNPRFPLPEDSSIEDIDDKLIPYLLKLASDNPVPNVDASRFEVEENRQIFSSERSAVLAFARAVKIPFEDLSTALLPASGSTIEHAAAQDRKTALRYWGLKVARGLLLRAGEGVNHAFVDRALGGLGRTSRSMRQEEQELNRRHQDVDTAEDEPLIASVGMQDRRRTADGDVEVEHEASDEEMLPIEDVREAAAEIREVERDGRQPDDGGDDSDSDAGMESSDDDRADSDEEAQSDSDADEATENLFRRSMFRRRRSKNIHPNLPIIPHHRTYTGHCNVKTVKDVNFYGPNDQYVVSGSDDGNLFIWDRQTSELVNILEGDGEVVNVIQNHPYEPMLAVSGIDSTIKIFGADARARRDARRGVGVKAADESEFSSLRFGMRRRPRQSRPQRDIPQNVAVGAGGEVFAVDRPSSNGPVPPEIYERLTRGADEAATEDDDEPGDSDMTSEPAMPAPDMPTFSTQGQEQPRRPLEPDYDSEDTLAPTRPPTPPTGLSSRKRMKDSYRITSANDEARRGGQRGTMITRSMLAQLAQRMGVGIRRGGGQANFGGLGGAAQGGEDDEEGGEGPQIVIGAEGEEGQVVVGDDCVVM